MCIVITEWKLSATWEKYETEEAKAISWQSKAGNSASCNRRKETEEWRGR